ncbi:MAG: AAA family ATPase [Tissierellaceae bacterium]|nr:AAA family ATPase [Tissierellaceae bacterium]
MSKLDILIKDFNKQYKEEIAARGIPRIETQKIPFSSPRANYMLYGGIPRGRIVEFAGEENGGKTTTALDIVANAQILFQEEWEKEIKDLEAIDKKKKEQQARLDYLKARGAKQIVYADCENTLDEEWAQNLGVDTDKLILLKPQSQTAEQIFEMLLQMIETDEVGLVIIDSLGVMLSAQAYEKTMEERTYGGIAAALTLFSKKAELSCTKYNCTLIGINQMREDMNSPYGGMITTGGKGWKHNCSVRLMFQKGAYIDERGNELKRSAESPAGNLVMINIAKTKVCKPDRRVGFYTLNYDNGIDIIADTVEVALKYGIIQQAGSWFNFVDIDTGEIIADGEGEVIKLQGKPNVIEYLEDNQYLFNEIYNKIKSLIN